MLSRLLRRVPRMFSNEVQTTTSTTSKGPASVTVYKDGQLVTQTQIVLKKSEDIEAYVINMVRNYFRTTYKNGVKRQSLLADHGLDSLDSIQISMQIEEELGYLISAETLSQFTSVKHYINYIEHVEAFKKESNKTPLS